MAKSSDIVIHGSERAHYIAQLTLCLLAGLSVAALGWAGWRGAFVGGKPGSSAESTPATASMAPANSTPAPFATPLHASATLPSPGLSVAPPLVPAPAPAPPPFPVPESKPKSILPPGREIANAQVREMVEAARAVRKLGDMQVALESLRAADLREPNHPEILSEMALTYEAMGLGDKAESAWRTVVAMGEANAGGYVALGKSKLESREAMPKANDRKAVSLGACQVIPDNTVTKGQRLALRIPIIAAPGVEIDPSQMDIHVYFYDKVGTDRIEPTRADPPTPSWVSAPVDWKEGEELVDFTYNMPELKPEELRELGKRSFYGYVVKIFYQDRLMGVQAEPKALVDYRPPGLGPAGADNALFPKN